MIDFGGDVIDFGGEVLNAGVAKTSFFLFLRKRSCLTYLLVVFDTTSIFLHLCIRFFIIHLVIISDEYENIFFSKT